MRTVILISFLKVTRIYENVQTKKSEHDNFYEVLYAFTRFKYKIAQATIFIKMSLNGILDLRTPY